MALDALEPPRRASFRARSIVQFRPGTSDETRDQALALVDGVFVGAVR